jgi:cytochrome c oxidase subunit 2
VSNEVQTILHPAGLHAGQLASVWWLMFWLCTAVYLVVLLGLGWAIWRRRRERSSDRKIGRVMAVAMTATVAILGVFLAYSLVIDRRVMADPSAPALTIEITGNQWWWNVIYEDPVPGRRITTANELHLPVGQPVRLRLRSNDVIHSFWVPNLHGKMDLIPGRENNLLLRPERIGVFRGQCAEFCGLQHAHMALDVTVESEADFQRWYDAQLKPAPEPDTDSERHGRQVFLTSACVMCHGIRGIPAFGTKGPDLTHLMGRRTIAAGTLPTTRGNLAAWIADPQGIKPGNHMPLVGIPTADLHPLLDYLTSLE